MSDLTNQRPDEPAQAGSLQPRVVPPTPWQEGYMEGRAPSGDSTSNPYWPPARTWREWHRGFEAGREDGRQGV